MRRAGAPAARAGCGLVLLHGRGGAAADMLGLAEALALPEVAVLAPEAPGRSWWPTSFLAPTAQMEPYVRQGLAAVSEAVARFTAEGIGPERIWLGGFSQGACLALEAFAREGAGLRGVFGLSGGLVGTADASDEPDPALYGHRPKRFDYAGRRDGAMAWLSVHAEDPHIPLARMRDSAEVLAEMGAEVATRVHPGAGHGLLAEDLAAMRARLAGPALRRRPGD
jgi:predicted esterase